MTSDVLEGAPVRTGRYAAILRRSAGILDAGVSSVGNLAIGVVAARSLPLADFGYVSTTMLVGLVLVGVGRALWGDPLTLTHAADDPAARRAAVREALSSYATTTLTAAPLVAALVTGILLTAGAPLPTAAALGVTLAALQPCLAVQDLLRQSAYCLARPLVAFANSAAWTGALLVLLAAGVWLLPTSHALFIGLWAGSALAGALVGATLLGLWPRFGAPLPWLRRHAALARRLLLDYALTQVTAETSVVVIAMVAGAAEAGLIRKAQIPLAPLIIMTSGIISVAQPALVRRVAAGETPRRIRRLVYLVAAAALGVSVLVGIAVWAVPEGIMRHLVGGDWEQARPLVLVLATYLGLGAVGGCQGIALRALGGLGRQVRYRLVLSPLLIALVALGARNGAHAATIGLCVGVLLVDLVWARLLATVDPSPAVAADPAAPAAIPGRTAEHA